MPTILITGGHGGIGLECSKQLASGYHLNLVLAGRSLERMEPIARELRTTYGIKVSTIKPDTSSLASVRSAAAQCHTMLDNGEIDSLQGIVCNAGVCLGGPVSYSVDGYEETFATNYLGHFLLVELLFDRLADSGRIVYTVSGTHDPDTADGKVMGIAEPDAIALANTGKDGKKPISTSKFYPTTKLCMILHAYELDRRLKKSGSSIASIARTIFPNQYVLLEILDSHTEDNIQYVDDVAIVRAIQNPSEATKELLKCKNNNIVYHTG
ncbi:MAG: SDR family NAD(P)-dependent oxidoreductase [Paenibacillus macerans]|uniref:SDR family NAD(P)-dependent oxidoreductase n=1 Tax=Paenibacillus macerans TaxID=44252 RepID=A0A6N8EY44_PAEMA|nr:SDR family NAD(P)-dependent oxidoreductase [Paenibacillus macerans]MDU5949503.1 SDR family NAD(P)-dependent oxidoreductase [Paenibacillus macerans]MDU7476842.1 SDR family NAD(P)-dependent oxidoreductase [Paenibacillus macerans]MUG24534.1 SDR family NAD(P)-dependent oxidoreductase [Paenibacillus macerans]UMV45699.1 SDR family NAD(P)-dependent oxidoreductase [Paenibacillus macerans]